MAINKPNGFYYTIKIKTRPNSYVSNMLIENCRYRLFLYNKGIEFVKNKCENNRYNVSKNEILAYLRNTYEKTSINRPYYLREYDYYFRGISECVEDDIYRSIRRVITSRINGQKADLNFIQFNKNCMSFRIKNKLHKR